MRRLAALVCCVLIGLSVSPPVALAATPILGGGSTYVEPAMADWVSNANTRGIPVQYTGTGSPAGVTGYGISTIDFAGTEAEVSSLEAAGIGGKPTRERGFQYVPDVAGAIAVMYNITDAGGNPVNYLHLNQQTIGRIFSGEITRWSDPAITATNGGKALPDQPIKLVGRGGDSGTTALFYDFVAHAAPGPYQNFMRRSNMGHFLPSTRPINLVGAVQAGINYQLMANSDMIAGFVRNQRWTIGYDEFAYAKKYDVQAAWVENAAGKWVQPYAENIAAALTRANLRPDLSQELSGVYTNPDPKTYPISAYSYLMTPCRPAPDRDTCRTVYSDPGKSETMVRFMEHVACQGQVNMAAAGFSPLPPNLSQEMMNSVARLSGRPATQLNAGNCNNPTFHGSLGAGASSPPDPFEAMGGVDKLTKGGQGPATNGPATSQQAAATNGPGAGEDAEDLANGGSKDWRNAEPAAYGEGAFGEFGAWAAGVLLVVIVTPLVARGLFRRFRRSAP
ncbi:PstS family phosphate ABC transporter substrate-binding protein [Amycolatopsis suaedae]|uniref:Phosphate ABC transporter substrate-binding protein n=1 Tax=Amycolatopsis suaedae TaxID=2510978 RepID=A0A4Q7IZZ7_9PSEU|nr:substrate-binding domain-containing protein [Amycolatopsis suaedae]RZQ59686.1 phosphate ABC transporter substrate-binding protein [Amycolatopsis suaedae]